MKQTLSQIPVDPGSLETTRTNASFTGFFEGAVRKKTLALIFLFMLQLPVLYVLYTSQISDFVKTRQEIVSRNEATSIKLISKICANETCKNANDLFKLRNWAQKYPLRSTIRKMVDKIQVDQKTQMSSADTNVKNNSDNLASENQVETTHTFSTILPETNNSTGASSATVSTTVQITTPTLASSTSKQSEESNKVNILPDCPETPPDLQGPIDVSFGHVAPEMKKMEGDNPLVKDGGHYKPPYCKALSKVAVIIPYRDRVEHLHYFLEYMHPTLQRQQLDYAIYIINQAGTGKFNRAKLMNIGYVESLKDYNFECFVFHDVDLVLENDKSLYSCPAKPRHLSAAVDKFNYVLPYGAIFGGVTELTKEQFEKANGYSNTFWGWGGEDDDMYNRVKFSGMEISRYPIEISRYKMISHAREKGNEPNPKRFDMIRQTASTMKTDGLNSLSYKLLSKEKHQLYTNVTVDVLVPAT
uniref:Beta-1,4-galactosyltransferase n=1 Tax=Ciona savignyi TaxID=51511 RepID=H2ZBZ8_CIOSA